MFNIMNIFHFTDTNILVLYAVYRNGMLAKKISGVTLSGLLT